MWLSGDVLKYVVDQLKELEEREEETAILMRKKPKKYLVEDYECCYPGK